MELNQSVYIKIIQESGDWFVEGEVEILERNPIHNNHILIRGKKLNNNLIHSELKLIQELNQTSDSQRNTYFLHYYFINKVVVCN